MPRVPVYQPQVQPGQVNEPRPARSPAPPPDAFGGNVAQADQNLGRAVERSGTLLAQHATELQEQEDQKQVLLNQSAFQKELQTVLEDEQPDELDRPKGLLNRNFAQARGVTEELDTKYGELREKYLDRVTSKGQKARLWQMMDSGYETARGSVMRHEANENRADIKQTLENSVESNINNAGYANDPAALSALILNAQKSISPGLKYLGMDAQVANQSLAGKMVESSVLGLLETDVAGARAILEANRPLISKKAQDDIAAKIAGKEFSDTRLGVWGGVSGPKFRMADGNMDQEKQRAAIYAMDIPTDKKDKIFEYVQSRNAEVKQALNQRHDAVDRAFSNELYGGKKQGATLDQSLRLAGKYGYDAYDIGLKEKAVKELYATPTQTDPAQYMALWEGVQNKFVDKRNIDQAFQKGQINAADWEGLRKEYYRQETGGSSPAEKEVWDRIKILASQKIPKKKRDAFLLTTQQAIQGKPAPEQWKIAQDMMKDVDIPWGFDKPAYEIALKQEDAQNTAFGAAYAEVGEPAVQAIGRGVLLRGGASWGLKDVVSLADTFGGMDNIKPGTPAGNAIQSLSKRGEMVTETNIKAVLAKYPDGNW